jgi:glycosyltransferase involved in cell wall biosynthesis
MKVEPTRRHETLRGSRALLIPPGKSGSAASIESARIAAAGLASGWEAQGGAVDVLFDGRLVSGDELIASAIRGPSAARKAASVLSALPSSIRPAIGDARAAVRGQERWKVQGDPADRYQCVLQYHHRFDRRGIAASRALGSPFLLRIEALEVREEREWGVRRPGYGRLVESAGELPLFRAADLLLPVSVAVDDQLAEAGLPPDRRCVLPNGVDVDVFSPGDPDPALTRRFRDKFVIGWIGGFRPFHGLEMIPEIAAALAARLPDAVLCLVGSGPMRASLSAQVRETPNVVLAPAVPYAQVPGWIRSFDVCLLLAPAGGFHYSPLKLREYMACGRPIIAPRIGEIPSVVADGRDASLVPPGDPESVVRALEKLARDRALRLGLGGQARTTAVHRESWAVRAGQLSEAIHAAGLDPGGVS